MQSNSVYVVLRNQNRENKKKSKKRYQKSYSQDYQKRRLNIYGRVNHLKRRYGYEYQNHSQRNSILDRLSNQFQNKTIQYLGNCRYIKKMSRKDKMQMKQKLNYFPKKNPIIKMFSIIQHSIRQRYLTYAFQRLIKPKKNKLIQIEQTYQENSQDSQSSSECYQ